MEPGYSSLVPLVTLPTTYFIKIMSNKTEMSLFDTMKRKDTVEQLIRQYQKKLDYNTVEFPLEHYLARNVRDGLLNAGIIWNEKTQSKFIETLLMGIPTLRVVIEIDKDGVEQIYYGNNQLLICMKFTRNLLTLMGGEFAQFDGLTFNDLLPSRQRWFKRIPVRTLVLDNQKESDYHYWLNIRKFLGG